MSIQNYCRIASEHEPGTTCEDCKLPVDKYGNTEGDFQNCSFPDCGCDGARLCMAGNANKDANTCNVEGMYQRKDKVARVAKMKLYGLVLEQEKSK